MGTNIDGPAGAVILADRPVLLEGGRSFDRGLVGAGSLEDFVGAAVHRDGALRARGRRGVVVTKALDNVVLNQGVLCPAVDG